MTLETEGGLEMIEPLQMHPNHQIYQRALGLLEKYFQEEEEAANSTAFSMSDVANSNSVMTPGGGFKF